LLCLALFKFYLKPCAYNTHSYLLSTYSTMIQVVVRNSLLGGVWGKEEREGKNPFEKGVGFDVEIKNEEHAFQVFVNGERCVTFAHRIDPHEIGGLQIQGDVEITGIQIV